MHLAHVPVVAAGVLLRRSLPAGDRWLLLRARKHGEWGFPKGHQDPGETVEDTARRECAEESGIALLAIDGSPLELHYHLPDGRAKTTVYFPALTATAEVVLSSEHDQAVWLDAAGVLRRLPHANLRGLFSAHLKDLAR